MLELIPSLKLSILDYIHSNINLIQLLIIGNPDNLATGRSPITEIPANCNFQHVYWFPYFIFGYLDVTLLGQTFLSKQDTVIPCLMLPV
jgi:hypothetical protein